ncbi:hypothetical protein [Noviherbaspirillum massiliense]|uniref:hypothetical protein n=1 Tax=Noviherbaspirillum massiliense TaxID=1465823 RepID=UPI000474B3B5|nr:hypothetical protein [Noviherbaspirillum massiliense]
MNETLCRAIQEKRVLELRYHGYSRIVEPHVYGRNKKEEEMLRCYQLAGGSDSGERAGWKMLKVDDTFLVHLTETQFLPRPDYQPEDKVIVDVFARI